MKCQILFSGKNKKNNIILSSAENAQRVVKVKVLNTNMSLLLLLWIIVACCASHYLHNIWCMN